MHSLKIALVTGTLLGSASLIAPAASAMPTSGLAAASNQLAADLQNVAWVCGPYRCWWRPNYWGPYGPYGSGSYASSGVYAAPSGVYAAPGLYPYHRWGGWWGWRR
jgi:hypothetical protein